MTKPAIWLCTKRRLRSAWFLVWFLFYGPSTHFRSFRARSVNLATLFLGKPPRQFTSTKCTFFRQSHWQLLFLNQRKRENGRRNVFMTKSPRKNVPDVGIELKAACMPSEHASDRATAPGIRPVWSESSLSAWRKRRSLATHWAQSIRWAHSHFVGFGMRRLIYTYTWQ